MPLPTPEYEATLDQRLRGGRGDEGEAARSTGRRGGDRVDAGASRAADSDPVVLDDSSPGTAVEVVPGTPALVDVETGETLAPTVENAARVLDAVSRMRDRLSAVREQAVDVVRAASREQGVKTFHVGDLDVVLTGGPGIDYDPLALAANLRRAGCPEPRVDDVVKTEVTYKVDRSVLRQLTGANDAYKNAAREAERPVEKRWSASTKPRRR